MENSNFVDYIRIYCRSGNGGAGSTHLRREKFVPKGGPDGGDGGRGGHIILKGNRNMWTLLHLRYRKHLIAGNGEPGGKQRSFGADGEDLIVEVPLGTVVRSEETGEIVAEVTDHDQTVILLKGGRGGLGNTHFKTSVLQTPRFAQPGEKGQEGWFIMELKILADVGLVGFPNAGKSTLLSVLSAAKPKIADYPFTTLTPNLGIVSYRDDFSFVMADIPGIIEGAAEGKGLGLRFLRHIERNSALLFVISAENAGVFDEYRILVNELEKYNPELLDKPRMLAITKCDLIDDDVREEIRKNLPPIPHVFISSITGQNLTELKDMIWETLHA
ncbi:MAG TPA: GTPase ObgE [Salinivirgaceae bacterium]|nr:GTPase ObgE [Salinivirgaceae bacterium]